MRTKPIHSIIFSLAVFSIIASCGSGQNKKETFPTKGKGLVAIRFSPDSAVEMPFSDLFSSMKIIDLQKSDKSLIPMMVQIIRTDSFLVINGGEHYYVFDAWGGFKKRVGNKGDGPGSIGFLNYYTADNHSIQSFYKTKWIRYGLDGSVLNEGKVPFEVNTKNFIHLNDSTWLFYVPYVMKTDTLRLWTTDQNFNIRKKYLFNGTNPQSGIGDLLKNIHQVGDEVYITDRVVDTIYKFSDTSAEPVYVFDRGIYNFRMQISMAELEHNEAVAYFTVLSDTAVIRAVAMNKKRYLIYHNRINNKTKTITKLTGGPDLITIGNVRASDSKGRLYWTLEYGYDTIIDDSAIKYGYADYILRKKQSQNPNRYLIVTTLR